MDTIISPTQLWKDYDPDELLLDISIVKESDSGGYKTRSFYYTAMNGEDGKIRAYAEFLYPLASYPVPVIVVLSDDDKISREYALRMVSGGYGALIINTSGSVSEQRCTLYPDSLSSGVYEKAEALLYSIEVREQDTPWYIWTVIARRGISALTKFSECDAGSIGVAGLRTGADLAVILAAVDDRVRAVLVMRQAGINKPIPAEDSARTQAGFDRYLIALSNAAYIKLVKKPMILHAGSNDPCNNLEFMSDLAAAVSPAVYVSMLISADRFSEISSEYKTADIMFYDSFIKGGDAPPARPRLEISAEDSEIAIKVNLDRIDDIDNVSVYVSSADVMSQFRYWRPLPVVKQDNSYLAVSPYISNCLHILYAKAVYKSGVTVSSLAYRIKPVKKVADSEETRLLYSDKDGVGCFVGDHSGKLVAPSAGVEFAEGVLGLRGVKAENGKLCTCITSDTRHRGYDGDVLQVMYCTKAEQKLVVELYICTAGAVMSYRYSSQIAAGQIWQKLLLSPGDFRNGENAQLPSFYDVCRIVFHAATPDFIINNMVWI